MFTDGQTDTQNVVKTSNGILLGQNREIQTPATWMNQLQKDKYFVVPLL